LDDGQFLEVELSRKQLDELALGIGDEVAIRVANAEEFDIREK
jgi:hypothetical protein